MKLNSKLVLVKLDKPEETDELGVYRAEEWKSLPPTGVVIDTSSDVTFCKKGDKVFIERYTAVQSPFGEDVRLCREDAIFAVL